MQLKIPDNKSFLKKTIFICAIILITLFTYSDVLHHQFLNFDDNEYVSENNHIQNGLNVDSIRWAFSFNGVAYWHPLTWVSHIIDCQLFGLNPGAHHMVNLLIHILNALMLFFILFKITGAYYKAGLIALLFAVHPLNVESVAWVTERKTVLSTLFFMTALYAYVKYTEKKKIWIYGLVLCSYTMGILSKPSILSFPFLLLILDYWPLNRFRINGINGMACVADEISGKASVRRFLTLRNSGAVFLFIEKIPLIIISLLSTYLSMLSMSKFGIVVTDNLVPMALRIQNVFVSIIKYLGYMVWPIKLSIFYPFPKSIPLTQVLLALFALVLITIATIVWRKNRPWFVVGWFWFLIALAPAIGLIQAGLWPEMANRFMYLPMIGLFILLVWECDAWINGRNAKELKIILCCIVLVYFVFLTKVQNLYYSNSYALFTRSIAVTGGNTIAYNGIGAALESLNRIDEALVYFRKTIEIDPTYDKALNNYGVCLSKKGEYHAANFYYQRSIDANPGWPVAYLNLGMNKYKMGLADEAMKLSKKALELDPGNSQAHYNCGYFLWEQGKWEEAIQHFQYAIKIKPNFIEARLNLSQIFEKVQRYDDALSEYEVLLKMKPADKGVTYYRMASLKSQQNRFKECKNYLDIALKYGFDVLPSLKSDVRFIKFRKTDLYAQLLENQPKKR